MEDGVARHGWGLRVVTRLVSLVPSNLQDCAYGLKGIGAVPYALVTAVVYTFAGRGSLASPRDDLTRTFAYLGAAASVFGLVSPLPGRLRSGNARRVAVTCITRTSGGLIHTPHTPVHAPIGTTGGSLQ